MALFDRLAALPLFAKLDAEVLRALAESARILPRLHAGERVYDVGSLSDALFVVVPGLAGGRPGTVLLELPVGEGRPVRIDRVIEGEFFGEAELLLAGLAERPGRRIFRATAASTTHLVAIDMARFAALLDRDAGLRRRIVREGSRRLHEALTQQTSLRLVDLEVNLADHLVERMAADGVFHGPHVGFSRPFRQEEIAAELGVSLRAVTERIGHWVRAGIIRTTPFAILDEERLRLIAETRSTAPAALVDEIAAAVDRRLEANDLAAARNLALDHLGRFPRAVPLVYRAALAAARAGAPDEAEAILAAAGLSGGTSAVRLAERIRLGAADPTGASDDAGIAEDAEEDEAIAQLVEDVLALRGRIAKERAFAAEGDERLAYARASARAYGQAFEQTGGHFSAVNAATMARLAGDDAGSDRFAKAARAAAGKLAGYWPRATEAEAALLLAGKAGAERAFAVAQESPDASDEKRGTTRRQLRRIAPVLGLDAAPLLARLPVRSPAVYCGHLFTPGLLSAERRRTMEERFKAEIAAILRERGTGPLFGALACGADLLIAEAALAEGAALNVILPLPPELFLAESVAVGEEEADGPDWAGRFEACLSRAATVQILNPNGVLRRDFADAMQHGLGHAMGRAIARAAALEAEPLLIAALAPGNAGRPSHTARGLDDWRSLGREAVELRFPFPRSGAKGAVPSAGGFAAVLFVFPAGENEHEAAVEHAVEAMATLAPEATPLRRALKNRRPSVAFVFPAADACLEAAARLGLVFDAEALPVRLICDFGPARDASGRPAAEPIARLDAAGDLAGFPTAHVLATAALAMAALAAGFPPAQLVPIGRGYGEGPRSGRVEAAVEVFAVLDQA